MDDKHILSELKSLKKQFNAQFSNSLEENVKSNQLGSAGFASSSSYRPSNYYGDWDLDQWEKEVGTQWQPKVDDWGKQITPFYPSKPLNPDIEEAIKKIIAQRSKKSSQPKVKKPKKQQLPQITPDEIFDRMVRKTLAKIKAKK